jgi:PKD repeat protein
MQPFSSLNNSTLQIRLSIVSFAIALFMLNSLQPSTAMALPDGNDAALKPTVFLPLISTGGQRQAPVVFNPPDATTLAGGQYTFDALNIPAGVVVTVEGPLTLHVNGSATIGGTLIGDCVPIFVEAQGDLIISGTVDNRCSDPDAEQVGDLQLYAHSGIQAGTLSTPATILTSGNLDVSNDPATPLWEYDVLPEQRSTVPLAPVCAATADSLWETTLPNLPATIRFTGEGADPDGGPIDMKWNFGDQSPAAVGPQVAHTYVAVGAYTVTLTVTDDDSQSCTAILALNIDDGENSFAQPVVEMQPVDLVIPVGEELAFTSDLADAQGGDLTYAWTFGDNISSNVLTATHRYAEAGRYAISLHVTDGEGNRREATASVYVYTPLTDLSTATIEHRFCPPNPLPPNVLLVNPATINNLPPAAPGRDGSSQTYRGRGTVIIAPGANIRGQDGGAGLARTGVGLVRGQNGGNGGSLNILVNGRLVLCAGVTLAAGDGGRGSNATATVPPVQTAHAYAGRGGDAGHRLRLQATNSIHIEGPVMVDPGSGGDGGDATATGDDGADRCDSAQAGAHALAVGGHGGDASKFFWGRGRVHGIRNITLINGLGGVGGDGNAIAGNGGKASCPTNATGGQGGHARARGGHGGHAPLTSAAARIRVLRPSQ